MSSIQLWSLLRGAAYFAATLCILISATPPASAADISMGHEVELQLRIQSGMGASRDEPYVVQLGKSSGETIRLTEAVAGTVLHFKHLKPGIYMACLQGDASHKECKSIDMFPPGNSRKYEFTAVITGPNTALNDINNNTVEFRQLRIPDKARQELGHSLQAATQGNAQEAVARLKHAIDIAPSYVEALNNLGYFYHLEGNQALSIQYLTRATELDPDYHAAWTNLAGDLLSLGRWEEALAAAQRGLAIWPDSISSNLQAAICNYRLQRYLKAEKYFDKLLRLDPASGSFPMLYLAHIALMDNRKEDAKANIRTFIKLHPNMPDAPYWIDTLQNMDSGKAIVLPATVAYNQRGLQIAGQGNK